MKSMTKAKSGLKPERSKLWSVQFDEEPIVVTFSKPVSYKHVKDYLLRIRGEDKLPKGTLIWKGWK